MRTAALPDTRHGMPDEQLLTALLTDGSSEQTVPGITEIYIYIYIYIYIHI